jgi:hypothetical protein
VGGVRSRAANTGEAPNIDMIITRIVVTLAVRQRGMLPIMLCLLSSVKVIKPQRGCPG